VRDFRKNIHFTYVLAAWNKCPRSKKEMQMSKPSRVWSIALPLSVVLLAAVYYIKVPEFRKAVDAKTPLANKLLGKWVQETGTKVIVLRSNEQDPLFAKATPPRGGAPMRPLGTPSPMVAKVPEPAPPPPAPPPPVAPPPVASAADLHAIAADRAKWPKTVVLMKPVTFPAVFKGKQVGTLVAPAGSEAILKYMKEDKLGLEFNGGGAWVPVAETDLLARVKGS
jgi:hypothetical protein